MQPNQPVVPAVNIENPVAHSENTQDKPLEVATSPEVLVAAGPADPAVISAAAPTAVPIVLMPEPVGSPEIVSPEPQEVIDDTAVLSGDAQYFSAVKKIMREDADKPYQEEEDSERLQKGYLKERFNVDVDIDVEEK